MSSIRVKDLAKELGVGNKEILQFLREVGIQAKSQMGALTEEEATQVRATARSLVGKTQVVDTEVQPGVIVRRRKPAREAKAPEPDAAPVIETPAATDMPLAEKPQAPTPPPPAETEPEPAEDAAPASEAGTRREKRPPRKAPVETTARII
ncbi:MAG: translation initiation factor IF-2 N-terminal domain-containing protein, partial [Desulfovibrionaceae bacterium]|nr:translation initiation factor IF-2 N-terminal domain-containing protein [Desulfovibrionaceae bacterium]